MNNKNSDSQNSIFWTSYSDLLTSLFFVMLVLYVVTFVVLKVEQSKYKADAEKLRRIQEIEKSVNTIDSSYFEYKPEYKKHILKVSVQFPVNESDINKLPSSTQSQLEGAGQSIKVQVLKNKRDDIKYLVIIEGQASKNIGQDLEYYNYKLSYDRALALLKFWKSKNITLGEGDLKNCEIVIAGSGQYGEPRSSEESKNQRFLIHIIPKIGTL